MPHGVQPHDQAENNKNCLKQYLYWLDHKIDGKSATKAIRLLFAPNVGAIPGSDSQRERVIKQKQHARNTNNNKARNII